MAKSNASKNVPPDIHTRPRTRAVAAQEAARETAPLVVESPRLPGAYDSSHKRPINRPRESELTPLPHSIKAVVRSRDGSSSGRRSRGERPLRSARAEERVPAGRPSSRQSTTTAQLAVLESSAQRREGRSTGSMGSEERRERRREKACRESSSSESSREERYARRLRRVKRAVSLMVENDLIAKLDADRTIEALLQSYSISNEDTNISFIQTHPVEKREPESRQEQYIPENRDVIEKAMSRLQRPRDTEETSDEYRRRINAAERQENSVRVDRDTARSTHPETHPRNRGQTRRERSAERADIRESTRIEKPETKPRSKHLKTNSEAYHILVEAEATAERKKREAKKADRNTRR